MYMCGGQKRACVSSTTTVYPLKRGLPLKLGLMFSWLGLKSASPTNAPPLTASYLSRSYFTVLQKIQQTDLL